MKKYIVIPLFVLLISLLFAENTPIMMLDLKTENLLGSTKAGKFYTPKDTYDTLKRSIPEFEQANMFGIKETYLKLNQSILDNTFIIYEDNQIKSKDLQLKTLKNADMGHADSFRITTSNKINLGVAISNKISWKLTPREVKPLAKNSKVYNEVVKNILLSKGFTDPKVSIKQIYSADLDNDKKNEIIIVGEHYESRMQKDTGRRSSSKPGEYSFILVRSLYEGEVRNILLRGSFNVSSIDSEESRVIPKTYELTSILDLNGDGTMEIIVYSYYYEGSFTTVYTLYKGVLKVVLAAGSGS